MEHLHRNSLSVFCQAILASSLENILYYCMPQEQRDREHLAELERKVMEKLARTDIIEAQRQSIETEMQRTRKDIATQEAWLKASTPFNDEDY